MCKSNFTLYGMSWTTGNKCKCFKFMVNRLIVINIVLKCINLSLFYLLFIIDRNK